MVNDPRNQFENDLENDSENVLKTRDSFWIREPGYEWGRVLTHPVRPIKNRSLLNICGILLENNFITEH